MKKAEGYRLKAVGKACAALFALATIGIISGCTGPRVAFMPAADAPMRAGPDMSGRVYIWTGATWELSRNSVAIPEGFYIWDAGDPCSTNIVKGK